MDVHPLFDQTGNLDINSIKSMFPKSNFSTVKANQRAPSRKDKAAIAAQHAKAIEEQIEAEKEKAKKELKLVEPPKELFDPTKNAYFDPNIVSKASMPKKRNIRKTFKFVQEGKYTHQADKLRQEALL
jgi:U4/U6 small nuclear ribonucleoprotein PRP3